MLNEKIKELREAALDFIEIADIPPHLRNDGLYRERRDELRTKAYLLREAGASVEGPHYKSELKEFANQVNDFLVLIDPLLRDANPTVRGRHEKIGASMRAAFDIVTRESPEETSRRCMGIPLVLPAIGLTELLKAARSFTEQNDIVHMNAGGWLKNAVEKLSFIELEK